MNTLWREAVESWMTHLTAARYPETTLRLRRQHLSQLAADISDPWATTLDDLIGWMARHDWKPNTAHSVRSTLRTFYTWAVDTGRTDSNPALKLPAVRRPDPNPHPMPEDAYVGAWRRGSRRERLILDLAVRCGLRRGEIAKVHTDDMLGGPGRWSLMVTGKGRKTRVIAIPDDLADRMREGGRGYLFPGRVDGHLSPDWVGSMISRMLPHGVTLHAGRHRFATRAYDGTKDLLTVQQALGHSSPATTQIYVKVADDAMRRAMMAAS